MMEKETALQFDPRFTNILQRIAEAIKEQDEKWGANRDLKPYHWNTILMEEVGEVARASFEMKGKKGIDSVIAETNYLEECAQVCAVSMQMMLNILGPYDPEME
jgi:NTP pyrophosphatase (non-canonical NTP hydrolase)